MRALAIVVAMLACSRPADAASPRAEPVRTEEWPESVPAFRWWEYAGTASLLAGSLAIRFTVDVSGDPTWSGGILADEWVYDTFFVRTPHRFRNWRTVGDVGYLSSYAWSALDPAIAALAFDPWAGLQMTMMNLEAFSVYSMILSVSQLIVRRERPSTRECVDQEYANELGISCARDNENVNRAFIGGHAGTVATAATLTCLHHINMPLWGSPEADALPCVTWTAMTVLVATSRTITGQHYLTDNLLGAGAGVISGLVPWALHYGQPTWEHAGKVTWVRPTMAVAVPYPGGIGVGVSGVIE